MAGTTPPIRSRLPVVRPQPAPVDGALCPRLCWRSLPVILAVSEQALAAAKAMHALGRIGEPTEIASVIEWLLDSKQSWVTGQVFGVDGGLGTIRTRG
ncbi:MAG: SDR family oxidoreductase [Planctomycetota bacterium]